MISTQAQQILDLRAEFPRYAEHCLKIVDKSGNTIPLVLNEAQLLIHRKLESQLESYGRVRALILKGRQQGACLAPETRVLTAALEWKKIADLSIGEEVVATDEDTALTDAGTHAKGRKMRTATVDAIVRTRLPAYRITLDDGRTLLCSGAHRWLVRGSQTQWSWRSIDGPRAIRVGWKLRSVTETWGSPDLNDAWFGGMIDGEGHFERRKTTGGLRLAISQVDGPVLERMRTHCVTRGYGAYNVSDDGPRKTKFGARAVHAVCISGMQAAFRVMGLSRPTRYNGMRWWEGMSMPDNGDREIVSIEPVGEMDLVDIQTSTGTFIAEGIVSHNSTYIEARFYWKITGAFGKRAFILTHEDKATANLFNMTKRYNDNCDPAFKPHTKLDNEKELYFDRLDCRYSVATAGARTTGRSATAQLFHGSEAAFWPGATQHMAGIGQIVPEEDGTEIILESTAYGVGNMFHQKWLDAVSGKSDYIAIFVPWFLQKEYRKALPHGFQIDEEEVRYKEAFNLDDQQIYWRRMKIIDDFDNDVTIFNQEYPATSEMAFMAGTKDSFVQPIVLAAAVRKKSTMLLGPVTIGVDPAESPHADADDSGVVVRKGFHLLRIARYHGYNGERLAGIVGELADEYEADAIFVDVGGIGTACYQFLTSAIAGNRQNVHAIQFGSKAMDEKRFANRSSEMWWRAREWLENPLAKIPLDLRFQIDATGRKMFRDAARRYRLETKEQMATRGIRSPDSFDAFALTFAIDVKETQARRDATILERFARLRDQSTGSSGTGMGA